MLSPLQPNLCSACQRAFWPPPRASCAPCTAYIPRLQHPSPYSTSSRVFGSTSSARKMGCCSTARVELSYSQQRPGESYETRACTQILCGRTLGRTDRPTNTAASNSSTLRMPLRPVSIRPHTQKGNSYNLYGSTIGVAASCGPEPVPTASYPPDGGPLDFTTFSSFVLGR